MSVYTHLTASDINSLLSCYDIGTLYHFEGIESGVENTNYFIDVKTGTEQKRYVLTLFEYLPEETLPFFVDFTSELSAGGISVPAPIRDKQRRALHIVKSKPCLISPCFPGKHLEKISVKHCQQVGIQLARIHLIGQKSSLQQKNQRGISWLQNQVDRLQPLLSRQDAQFMAQQWSFITTELTELDALPSGLIHGDLFHDNVLFENDQITGIIDFYNACHDYLLYDLAVTVNDWCIKSDLSLDDHRVIAITRAYATVRPLTQQEKHAWPLMLTLAAFRFWISRLITFVYPEQAIDDAHSGNQLLNFKDPDEFRKILALRLKANTPALP